MLRGSKLGPPRSGDAHLGKNCISVVEDLLRHPLARVHISSMPEAPEDLEVPARTARHCAAGGAAHNAADLTASHASTDSRLSAFLGVLTSYVHFCLLGRVVLQLSSPALIAM